MCQAVVSFKIEVTFVEAKVRVGILIVDMAAVVVLWNWQKLFVC